jgi:hypothetical protein
MGTEQRASDQVTTTEESPERRQPEEPNVALTRGQVNAVQSSLKGGNHTFPHSETVRDLPVRRAQGACVRISKGWKRLVISRPQETRLQNKRVGARLIAVGYPEYLR